MRLSLEADPRPPMTKGEIRRARRAGLTPVSVSEQGQETKHYLVPAIRLLDILRRGGSSPLIELKTDGAARSQLVLPRTVQRDPVSRVLQQVGMVRVSARKPITAPVRIVFVGEPEPVSQGVAVLAHEATEIEIRALPDKLPTHIDVEVAHLQIGDKLLASDIPASPDYEVASSPDTLLAVVQTVRAAVSEEGAVEEPSPEAQAAEETAI